ncbi:ornithine carbamoyltransferase [Sphingosinicella ginsenosidimutans]|uniref:Ornithine carbamoyltransferase n=1 Tax=Allosphingosinicella ginsenosidimutans TaxID=1176539 RepID=A0A5C6TPP3_9SPHN|nr:ornithine carbamoyltransferase [Sphingosinicella ginsenosidimutans]TXC62492.1 ornithine carbamoyltransferase [Sphingosinicella ginsenosidimutans]
MTKLLTIADLAGGALAEVLELAERADLGAPLAGKGAALVFQKPSARTRNSTEMAVVQLGGHPVYIQKDEVGIDTRETAEDVARTLACYHSVIAARVMDHDHLVRMSNAVSIPVLNLLSDKEHPLQALADLLTIKQLVGRLEGVRIAFVGDADNNVARSLAHACGEIGAELTLAGPEAYRLKDAPDFVRQVVDPLEGVKGADIVYTDVWVSMGQDAETAERMAAFAPYQVDAAMMAATNDAWFLHCLPARRGEEVTHEVIESPKSAVWRQAENRMHTARAALAWLLGVR